MSMDYDVPINDKIDPVPSPQACLDGLTRHFQTYEQTVSMLQRENNELREQLANSLRQIDILRSQQSAQQVGNQVPYQSPVPRPQPQIIHQREEVEKDFTSPTIVTGANQPQIQGGPPVALKQISEQKAITSTMVSNTPVKPPPKAARHIFMHSRAIVRLAITSGLLLTGSRDGTARVWNASDQQFKTSLQTFRASGQIVSVSLLPQNQVLAISQKNKTVQFYQLDTALSALAEYADVSDLTEALLKNTQTGELQFAFSEAITCCAELNPAQLVIFGAGFCVSLQQESGSLTQGQQTAMAEPNGEPMYFCGAVSCQGNVYACARERYTNKGQMVGAYEPFSATHQKTGSRVIQITQAMKPATFTLTGPGDLTPLSMFTVDKAVVLLFSSFEQKMAALDEKGGFMFLKESSPHVIEGQIMCGCACLNRIYVIAGQQFEPVKVLIYAFEGTEVRFLEAVTIEDFCGYATSVAVEAGQIVIGGLDGDVIVKYL